MREILFRGKSVDNGKWIEGELLHDMKNRPHIYWTTPKELPVFFSNNAIVIPETVGQYTGLQDKNSKKIFEGDICKDSLGTLFVVEYDEDNARFIGRTTENKLVYVGREPRVEVIGNIYSNPGLLEVE
ncbi:MAG: YopX family protein [Clostridia bacterium]|nr:YopX family protein [Clostridia bacterium]